MAELSVIRRLIGPRKRHVTINLDAAKEIKGCPIDGDLEQLLDETSDKQHQLQQHLSIKTFTYSWRMPLKLQENRID